MSDRGHEVPATAGHDSSRVARGQVLTAVSDGIVALFKEYYGKGPPRSRQTTRSSS